MGIVSLGCACGGGCGHGGDGLGHTINSDSASGSIYGPEAGYYMTAAEFNAWQVAQSAINAANYAAAVGAAGALAQQINSGAVPYNTPVTYATQPNAVAPVIANPILVAPGSSQASDMRLSTSSTMGSSTGTSYGTYSLQEIGWVPISMVDLATEQNLIRNYPNMTYAQYKAAKANPVVTSPAVVVPTPVIPVPVISPGPAVVIPPASTGVSVPTVPVTSQTAQQTIQATGTTTTTTNDFIQSSENFLTSKFFGPNQPVSNWVGISAILGLYMFFSPEFRRGFLGD